MRRTCRVVRRHALTVALPRRTLGAFAARACVRPAPRPCLLCSDTLPWIEPTCSGDNTSSSSTPVSDTSSKSCMTYALTMKREEGSLAGLDVLLERWRVRRATCRSKSTAIAELLTSCVDTANRASNAGTTARPNVPHTPGQEVCDMDGSEGAIVAWLVQRFLYVFAEGAGAATMTTTTTMSAQSLTSCTAGELLWVLCYAVRSTEVPATAVQELMRALLDRLEATQTRDVATARSNVEDARCGVAVSVMMSPSVEEGIVQVLRVAVPVQLANVVLSLTTTISDDEKVLQSALGHTSQPHAIRDNVAPAFGIPRVWRPIVSPTLARHCLRFVAGALHTSGTKILQDGSCVTTAVQTLLQECIYCALPPSSLTAHRYINGNGDCVGGASSPSCGPSGLELAKATVYALKHAPCIMLCHLMAYYEAERVVDGRLRNNLLARCGTTVLHLSQAGLYLDSTAHTTLQRTTSALLTSTGSDAQDVDQGLVHGCMLLHALGEYHAIREVYRTHATLRETAFSVSACVRLGDVSAALHALRMMAESRPAGWPKLSPAVMEAMTDVSRLVGARGVATQVAELYDSLVAFRNASLLTSHMLSVVLAGLCDRVTRLADELGPERSLQPRRVLEHILPMLRAVLNYIGDDFNADVILDLLDVALRVDRVAVPLITGIVWTLQRASGLAVRDLFRPCDTTSTDDKEAQHNEKTDAAVPFVKYYVLCNARTCYRRDGVLDHLLVVWQLDRAVVWRRRATELVPPYKLWRCASCGRANSDRYNYCLCTAQQHSYVRCAGCGYAQDERLSRCRCCGRAMSARAIAGVVVRKVWNCRQCGAKNRARQMWHCMHCHAATGPLFAHDASRTSNSQATQVKQTVCNEQAAEQKVRASSSKYHFCHCPMTELYAQQIGYCHRCGVFRDNYAAKASAVWRCSACHELRSSLERCCPRCPQVECLPALTLRLARERRFCHQCGRPVQNAFARTCPHCHASEEWLRDTLPPAPAVPIIADGPKKLDKSQEIKGHAENDTQVTTPQEATAPDAIADKTQHAPVLLLLLCGRCGTVQPAHATDTTASLCSHCGTALVLHGASRTAQPLESAVQCACCKQQLSHETLLSLICPHCGTSMHSAVSHARDVTTHSQAWQAMTLIHTCNAFMHCLMRDEQRACGAEATRDSSEAEPGVNNVQPLYISAPTERLLRDALEHITTADNAEGSDAVCIDWSLLKTQLDTCIAQLPRGAALQSRLHASQTRRAAALMKWLLAQLYQRCTHTESSDAEVKLSTIYDETERCEHCLSGHPAALCGMDFLCQATPVMSTSSNDDVQRVKWQCEVCGTACHNDGLQRYFCPTCLTLRAEVQRLMPAECWLCVDCGRANVEFETYCIHCGALAPQGSQGTAQCIPFLPAKCATCDTLFLCPRCPNCAEAEQGAVPHTPSVQHPATPHAIPQQQQQYTLPVPPPPEPLVETQRTSGAPIVHTAHLMSECTAARTLPVAHK